MRLSILLLYDFNDYGRLRTVCLQSQVDVNKDYRTHTDSDQRLELFLNNSKRLKETRPHLTLDLKAKK